mmetsp:Transcript_5521/g.13734  ORF Transcript_5521/g.13734 Transcript_5521/m.13734 type:complete len:111 (+) Transcript_5521:639-971(+)
MPAAPRMVSSRCQLDPRLKISMSPLARPSARREQSAPKARHSIDDGIQSTNRHRCTATSCAGAARGFSRVDAGFFCFMGLEGDGRPVPILERGAVPAALGRHVGVAMPSL